MIYNSTAMNYNGTKLLLCILVINSSYSTAFGNLFTVLDGKKNTGAPYKTAEANDIQECILRCDLCNLVSVNYEMTTKICQCFNKITPFTDSPGWKAAFMVKSLL